MCVTVCVLPQAHVRMRVHPCTMFVCLCARVFAFGVGAVVKNVEVQTGAALLPKCSSKDRDTSQSQVVRVLSAHCVVIPDTCGV